MNEGLAVTWIAIPEPGTVALLALGGLALIRRRRAA
ncbi:MAG: PEP-CTERM sorting domain-containing protein [Lentisphaeria bacterium]